MGSYLVGVDIGGTFTDCVVIDESGAVTTAKAPSTPGNFAQGMIDAILGAAEKLGIAPARLYEQVALLSHGTTVGTNAVVQKRGARIGLITTKGHNDVIHIMRGSRGIGGRDVRQVVHFPESRKPDPIVPKRLIEGVSERVDCFGKVVVPLNEEEAEAAIRRLLEKGVEAIAICFLWSFLHPAHEHRLRDMVKRLAPDLFVTCSADLVPKWGEYERTTATAINAYIGPLTSGYLSELDRRLSDLGYRQPLQITQCGGGTISVDKAMEAPLLTLDSGPVSGVTGSLYLGRVMGYPNIITTDMGGTSFDVGIIYEGKPAYSFVSNVNQYEYFIPKVDIQAIGSGGGSLVRIDEITQDHAGRPRQRRRGAGAGLLRQGRHGRHRDRRRCRARATSIPTISPAAASGSTRPRPNEAVQDVADRLGMSLLDCASGIAKIAEFQMADIIRKMTVGKGFDPARFRALRLRRRGAGACRRLRARARRRQGGDPADARPPPPGAPSAPPRPTSCTSTSRSTSWPRPSRPSASTATSSGWSETARRQMDQGRHRAPRGSVCISRIDMRHKGQINEVEVAARGKPRSQGDFEAALREALPPPLRAALRHRLVLPRRHGSRSSRSACAPPPRRRARVSSPPSR